MLAAEALEHDGDDGIEGEALHSESGNDPEGDEGDGDDMEEDGPDQAWNAAGLAPGATQVLVDGPKKVSGGLLPIYHARLKISY